VGVTFDSFTLPASAISLVPKYTATGGWDSNFSESDITSKITYTFQGDGHTQVYNYPYDEVTIAKQIELNAIDTNNEYAQRPWPPPLYKQTFYYKGDVLKDESDKDVFYNAYIGVQQVSGTDINWMRLNDSTTNPGFNAPDCTVVNYLPPVPLKFKLSKEIAEL
jgi:hypothetical protein